VTCYTTVASCTTILAVGARPSGTTLSGGCGITVVYGCIAPAATTASTFRTIDAIGPSCGTYSTGVGTAALSTIAATACAGAPVAARTANYVDG
jgi:hypothetical protein